MVKLNINSVLSNRLALDPNRNSFQGKRNMYQVLGYKNDLYINDYIAKYNRQDIASRIINAFPDAIWSSSPIITSNDESQTQSLFDKEFEEISERIRLFHYLNRLDKLSRLGRYAILLLGIGDGKPLEEPVIRSKNIDYIMPFSEANISIEQYDRNPMSKRYQKPVLYKITSGVTENTQNIVHHSRLIHVAENCLDNDVFGTPTLQNVYNRLDDLEKIIGGSAEIFWLNGRGGINLNASIDTDINDPEKLEEHAENYANQLTRILKTRGIDVKTLELGIHDPNGHVSVILDIISGATSIPQRILTGSEMGQLASSQDNINWQTRVKERRENFCEPLILKPTINRFIELGLLPKSNYDISWQDSSLATSQEKADIAVKLSQSLSSYVNSNGGDSIIPPEQFVEEILQMQYRKDTIDSVFEDDEED